MSNPKHIIATTRVDKTIKYIEEIIHCDSSCTDARYYKNMAYMEKAGDVCSTIEKETKDKQAFIQFLRIVLQLDEKTEQIMKSIDEYSRLKRSGKQFSEREKIKLTNAAEDFYMTIGDIFEKTKIVDFLVKRHNLVCTEAGLKYLTTNTQDVLREFKPSRIQQDYTIIFAKIAFYINKLTKFITYAQYQMMYKQDYLSSKKVNPERLKHISKLKTDFIISVYNATVDGESLSVKEEHELKIKEFQKEYERLFGEYFEDLNLRQDLIDVTIYKHVQNKLYEFKNAIAIFSVAKLLNTYYKKKNIPGIKNWGISEDESDRYIFGIDLYGYPQHLTMHMNSNYLDVVVDQIREKVSFCKLSTVKLPHYQTCRSIAGEVFPTNVIVPTNSRQREALKEHAKREPNNKFVQALLAQVSSKESLVFDSPTIEYKSKSLTD